MKIKRNGQEFELTLSELIEANEEYELDCMYVDVKGTYEQRDDDIDIQDEELRNIASEAKRLLGKNDTYFEAYWDTVNYAISEYVSANKSHM